MGVVSITIGEPRDKKESTPHEIVLKFRLIRIKLLSRLNFHNL